MSVFRDTNAERGERRTYTVDEAARVLGCSRAHLYNLVNRGAVPTIPNMGRRRLIPRTAIDRMLGDPEAVA